MTMNLEPQWIVGFVDGEGCFNLDVHMHQEMLWKLQMQPEFTVVQNEIDIQVLYALKDYFKCGSVKTPNNTVNRKAPNNKAPNNKAPNNKAPNNKAPNNKAPNNKAPNNKDQTGTRYHYRVKNLQDLNAKIIPFFEKHKLKTKKRIEFEKFRTIVQLMFGGYHTQSLKNFLEVIHKGMELRERSSYQLKKQSQSTKRTKVSEQIQKLEEYLLTKDTK